MIKGLWSTLSILMFICKKLENLTIKLTFIIANKGKNIPATIISFCCIFSISLINKSKNAPKAKPITNTIADNLIPCMTNIKGIKIIEIIKLPANATNKTTQ